mmetsp:Transcript_57088/g.105545  ORF Transcript_57088/g.105545 Transcript_57088/m.105545 type:complete len:216 (+) Transcript_57088:79-726(+)
MANLNFLVTVWIANFWIVTASSCSHRQNGQTCEQVEAASLLQTRTLNVRVPPSGTSGEADRSKCADTSEWLASMLQTGAELGRSAEPADSDILRLQENMGILCSCSDVQRVEIRNLQSKACEPDGGLSPIDPIPGNCSSDGSWFLNGTCCEGFRERWDWWSFGYTCDEVTCARAGERPDSHSKILPCCESLVEERVVWDNGTEMLLCVEPATTTT